MATITTIAAGDSITNSRSDINTNFANLNSDKIETSVIDTDTALSANSDSKIPTQKAVKAYVDAIAPTITFAGVRVYQTGTTSIDGSAYTALAFAAENYDSDAFHDNASNNSRLTVPTGKAGKYMIGGSMKITTTSAKTAGIQIRLNGSTVIAASTGQGGVVNVNSVSVATTYNLSEADYVELLGASTSAETSSGDANTSFWMQRIG